MFKFVHTWFWRKVVSVISTDSWPALTDIRSSLDYDRSRFATPLVCVFPTAH